MYFVKIAAEFTPRYVEPMMDLEVMRPLSARYLLHYQNGRKPLPVPKVAARGATLTTWRGPSLPPAPSVSYTRASRFATTFLKSPKGDVTCPL